MLFEKIKKLADEKHLSIKELESQAGLANGTIGKWRESEPGALNLYKVSKILGTSIDELVKD